MHLGRGAFNYLLFFGGLNSKDKREVLLGEAGLPFGRNLPILSHMPVCWISTPKTSHLPDMPRNEQETTVMVSQYETERMGRKP